MADILSALIFSPHPETRASLRGCLEDALTPSIAVEEIATLSRGVDRVLSRKPDLAFFDITNEMDEALRTIPSLREGAPETRLVAVYNPLQIPDNVLLSDLFLKAMRSGFFDFLRAPVSPQDLARIIDRARGSAAEAGQEAGLPGTIISMVSSKGGVGKTAIAVNLASTLAQQAPGEVVIVDASFDLGNTREFLALDPEHNFYDAYMQREKLDRDMLIGLMTQHQPSGIYLMDSPRKVEQMVAIQDHGVTQVLLALRKSFRYIIVDTVPILSPILLAVGDLSKYILVVTEALVPTIKGTRALVDILHEAGYDMTRMRIILNRFTRFSGNIEPHLVTESLGHGIDFLLPYDRRLHEAANRGVPYCVWHSNTTFAQGIQRIAREVSGLPSVPPKPGLFSRIASIIAAPGNFIERKSSEGA